MLRLYKYSYVTNGGRGTHFTNSTDRKEVHKEIRVWYEHQRMYNKNSRLSGLRVYQCRINKDRT